MAYHPHLHVLVPAGGLSDDGETWIASRPDFLVPPTPQVGREMTRMLQMSRLALVIVFLIVLKPFA